MDNRERHTSFDLRKKIAIRLAATVGLKIQRNFPQVSCDYSMGVSLKEIVEGYNLRGKYGVTLNVAMTAVRYAVRGYGGCERVSSYPGLIKDSDLLRKLHLNHLILGGNATSEQGKGIHLGTLEERRRLARVAGKMGGNARSRDPNSFKEKMKRIGRDRGLESLRNKTGIHAQDYDHRTDGIQSAINRGEQPWNRTLFLDGGREISAIELVCLFANRTEFLIQSGPNMGNVNLRLLSEVFGRTPGAIYAALKRYNGFLDS